MFIKRVQALIVTGVSLVMINSSFATESLRHAYADDFLIGALSPLGGWLVYEAFKRGWVLKLDFGRGGAKLAFDRGAEIEGLRDFVRAANSESGPRIEMP